MSTKPAPRPAPRPGPRPAPVRPASAKYVSPKRKLSVVDILSFVAGMAMLVGIVYLAYRTQVVGEPVENVVPFLFEKIDSMGVQAVHPESADTPSASDKKSTPGGVAPAESHPDVSDPDDTYFGHRIDGSAKPKEPASSN